MTLVLGFYSLLLGLSHKMRCFLVPRPRRPLRGASILDPRLTPYSCKPGDDLKDINSDFFGALQQKLLQCNNNRNILKLFDYFTPLRIGPNPQCASRFTS
jgi:hypothetical protein